jgi:YD repeat-containing protein
MRHLGDTSAAIAAGYTNSLHRDLKSPQTLAVILGLLCLLAATSSHAVKCIQAGYTADEGAIYCTPSYITTTYFYSFVGWPRMELGPFSTFSEAADAMQERLMGSPYCAQNTTGGGPIVDAPWGTYGHRVTSRHSRSLEFTSGPYVRDHSQKCTYSGEGHWQVIKVEYAECRGGQTYDWFLESEGGDNTMVCGSPLPSKECKKGNPVDIFSGKKIQDEHHILGYGGDGLSLSWHYNSQRKPAMAYFGPSVSTYPLLTREDPVWMNNFEKRLNFNNHGIRPVLERVNPADANSLFLVEIGEDTWADALGLVIPEMEERPEEPVERWKYTGPDGNSEFYDPRGRLVKETDRQGRATTLSYVDNRLARVRNWKGQTLDFSYDANGVLESVTDSLGHRYRYQFNDEGLLTSVAFPDETPDDNTDNPTRSYRYEHEPIPHALTSIIDENGQVAASWTYDGNGRATSSSHAGGADTTTFSYGASSTTVTNALGKETTYHYGTVQNAHGVVLKNVNVIQHVEGHPSTYCAGANTNYEYNSDGYVTKKIDWNGNETRYRRDTEGRELSRTEAPYTDESRTITTTWDESLDKPLVVAEPGRVTEYQYDSDGKVLSKTQRNITD